MIKKRTVVLLLSMIFFVLGTSTTWAQVQDISFEQVLEPNIMVDQVYDFRDGIAAVRLFDDGGAFRVGYVDRYGQLVIPFRQYGFDPLWQTPQFSYGLVPVRSLADGATGFFDITGELVIPAIYGFARGFSEGLAAVNYRGQWGFIDTQGNTHVPFIYERAGDFNEGVAPVMLNGRWGFVDTTGELVIPFVLEHDETQGDDFIHPGFFEGLASVLVVGDDGPRWGYLNRLGNRIHSYLYPIVYGFNEGRALVMRFDSDGNTLFGYIDESGNEIVPPVYDLGRCFSEGFAAVSFNGQWGFIDDQGRVQVPVRYDYVRSFANGLAAVQNGGLWGFIDRFGNEVVPLVYDDVGDFAYGLAPVMINDDDDDDGSRWGFVDHMNNIVVPIENLDATGFSENLAWIRKPEGWGIIEVIRENGSEIYESVHYIYQPTAIYYQFIPNPYVLEAVVCPDSAKDAIHAVIAALTDEQRTSGCALNTLALFIENVIRRGVSQELPADGIVTAAILQNATYEAQTLWHTVQDIIHEENIFLLRQLRVNLNFTTLERESITLAFPNDVSEIGFDALTVEMGLATITIIREQIIQGNEITITSGSPVRIDEPIHASFTRISIRSFLSSPVEYLILYWAVVAILILLLVWGILASFGHKLRIWVVPTFIAIFVLANIWTLGRGIENESIENPAHEDGYINAVEIAMPHSMRVVISVPVNNVNPVGLVVFNQHDLVQPSKYNPVTNKVDARISASGIFSLGHIELSFDDISEKDPIMQNAIKTLASLAIMPTEGSSFRPDSGITREEFVVALVGVLGLPTEGIANIFPDNHPENLHYEVIASIAYHGLVSGFGDGYFRGSWAIPKSDLVIVLGRALTNYMGYWFLVDTDELLEQYYDYDRIDSRVHASAALVTTTNILAPRSDNRFAPESVMTRGDVAVVLYRLYERIWF